MATREIKFTVEEEAIPLFVAAFTDTYNYAAKVVQTDADGNPTEVDNPETAQEFTKRKIKEFALEVVNAYKIKKAQQDLVVAPVASEVVGI